MDCILIGLIIIVIVMIIVSRAREECFANIGEKVDAFAQWARENGDSPRYDKFIADHPDSNIVEYTRVRNLISTGGIHDKDTIKRTLRME